MLLNHQGHMNVKVQGLKKRFGGATANIEIYLYGCKYLFCEYLFCNCFFYIFNIMVVNNGKIKTLQYLKG